MPIWTEMNRQPPHGGSPPNAKISPTVSPPVVAQNRLGLDLQRRDGDCSAQTGDDAGICFRRRSGCCFSPSVLHGIAAPAITESPDRLLVHCGSMSRMCNPPSSSVVGSTAVESPAPAAPQPPPAPNVALSPGGVVAGYVDSANWSSSPQAPGSSDNKIVENLRLIRNNGSIQNQENQVATAETPNNPPITGIAGCQPPGNGWRERWRWRRTWRRRSRWTRRSRWRTWRGRRRCGRCGGSGWRWRWWFGGGGEAVVCGGGGGGGASAGSDYAGADAPLANLDFVWLR